TEGELLDEFEKGDDIPASVAPEAVKDPGSGVDVERGRPFVMVRERTAALRLCPGCRNQTRIAGDDLVDPGPLPDLFEGVIGDPHATLLTVTAPRASWWPRSTLA